MRGRGIRVGLVISLCACTLAGAGPVQGTQPAAPAPDDTSVQQPSPDVATPKVSMAAAVMTDERFFSKELAAKLQKKFMEDFTYIMVSFPGAPQEAGLTVSSLKLKSKERFAIADVTAAHTPTKVIERHELTTSRSPNGQLQKRQVTAYCFDNLLLGVPSSTNDGRVEWVALRATKW